MKIVHIDFTGTYNEDMSYQENLLPRENARDGHDVTFITTCYKWSNGIVTYTGPEDKIMIDGVRLIRMPYQRIFTGFITNKLRYVQNIYSVLQKIKPDVIMVHCLQTYALKDIVKYKNDNDNVLLYADSHTDFNNSAKNFLSKNILHKLIYKRVIKEMYPFLDKLFYISLECKDFLTEIYGLPDSKMEFLPLGGVIKDEKEKEKIRQKIRAYHGLEENDILLIHSGKMNKLKRTIELVKSFNRIQSKKLHLYLVGSIDTDISNDLQVLLEKDSRIKYLGWKTSDILLEYLCAADLYLQPGSQSATMQNAICCGCPIMVYPYKSHKPFLEGNGFYVKNPDEIEKCLEMVTKSPGILKKMGLSSYRIAKEKLDYQILSKRVIQ